MLELAVIKMAPGNRMVRAGFGQHDDGWFARADFWVYGFRVAYVKEQA